MLPPKAPPKDYDNPELDAWRVSVWQYLLQNPSNTVPTTATSNGSKGEWAFNTTHLYVCVAENTWRRVALSAW